MKVKFVPMNKEVEIKPGQSVLHAAEDNGIYIKSVCRGVPSCAECRVYIVDQGDNVFRPNQTELQLIGSGWFLDQRRLSCQLMCTGDVTIDVSEQLAKQKELREPSVGTRSQKAIRGDRVEEETVIRDRTDDTDARPRSQGARAGKEMGGGGNRSGGNSQAAGSRGGGSRGGRGGLERQSAPQSSDAKPVIQPKSAIIPKSRS